MFQPYEKILNTAPAGAVVIIAVALVAGACQPTIKIEAPREPITINLNIKLDADVRVRLEKEAREDVKTNSIF